MVMVCVKGVMDRTAPGIIIAVGREGAALKGVCVASPGQKLTPVVVGPDFNGESR